MVQNKQTRLLPLAYLFTAVSDTETQPAGHFGNVFSSGVCADMALSRQDIGCTSEKQLELSLWGFGVFEKKFQPPVLHAGHCLCDF